MQQVHVTNNLLHMPVSPACAWRTSGSHGHGITSTAVMTCMQCQNATMKGRLDEQSGSNSCGIFHAIISLLLSALNPKLPSSGPSQRSIICSGWAAALHGKDDI